MLRYFPRQQPQNIQRILLLLRDKRAIPIVDITLNAIRIRYKTPKTKSQTPPRLVIRIRICVFIRHLVGERYWIEWCPPDIAYRKVGMPATQKACWQCQRREESVTFRICCTLITDNRMSFVGRYEGGTSFLFQLNRQRRTKQLRFMQFPNSSIYCRQFIYYRI